MNEQGTVEWLEERIGCIGGSDIEFVCGSAAASQRILGIKIRELLTGEVEVINAKPLAWGNQHESKPKAIYRFEHSEVADSGFVTHPDFPRFGCSPDGLVGDDGMIQIKCPINPIHHVLTVCEGKIKPEYMKQMQWEMFVTGRRWSDFISYDPRIPVKSQMVVKRVEWDEEVIGKLLDGATEFLKKLDSYMEKLI